MNKNYIYKYLSGETTKEENDILLDWVNKNKKNEKFFIEQANIWIWQNMPQKRARAEDYAEFKELLKSKKKSKIILNKSVVLSAAAIFLCLFTLNLTLFYYSKKDSKSLTPESDILTAQNIKYKKIAVIKEFYTDKGVKAKLILPDSSVVWLNSGTKISYPDEFGEKARIISFSGEAYFDVAKDAERPMIINNNKGFQVKVLGTKFNLKNYDDDNSAQVTLYSGKIEVLRKNGEGRDEIISVLPNETAVILERNPIKKTRLNDAYTLSEWREGKIIFSETKMPQVIKTLERWHGVKFRVTDPQVLDYMFTAKFNSESIVQIMEFLKMTTFIDYRILNNEIILTKR